MSVLVNLSDCLIKNYFGTAASLVCTHMNWGPKTLKSLVRLTGLPIEKVIKVLRVLIQHEFISFTFDRLEKYYEYTLQHQKVLLIAGYAKYLIIINDLYGLEAKLLVQELMHYAVLDIPFLLKDVELFYSEEFRRANLVFSKLRNSLKDLIKDGFIIKVYKNPDDLPYSSLPTQKDSNASYTFVSDSDLEDENVHWKLNHDRFFLEFRNEVIMKAANRRVEINEAIILKHIIKLSYSLLDPWQPITNYVSIQSLHASIEVNENGAAEILKYLNQHIYVMDGEPLKMVFCSEKGVTINMKYLVTMLTATAISYMIHQKFGPVAARIFRIIRAKKYVELEQIQQIAMVPDKDVKQITYKLLGNHFVQMQDVRAPGNSVMATKSVFLFHVDLDAVVKTATEMCYKALYNFFERRANEQTRYSHLYEKKIHTDSLMVNLERRGATTEQIFELVHDYMTPPEMSMLLSIEKFMKKFEFSECQIIDTILLLRIYTFYNVKKKVK